MPNNTAVLRKCFQCEEESSSSKPFCPNCSAPLELPAFIASRVKLEVAEAIRGRDILEIDSGQRVFAKAWNLLVKVGSTVIAVLVIAGTVGFFHVKSLRDSIEATASSFQEEAKKARGELTAAETLVPEVEAMQGKLNGALNTLSSDDAYAKHIWGARLSLNFQMAYVDPHRVVIVPPSPANPRTLIIVLLPSLPVQNTIAVQFHTIAVPPDDVLHWQNVAVIYWDEPSTNLREHNLYVSYFPDPDIKPQVQALSIANGQVLADGKPMPNGIAYGSVTYPGEHK